MTKPTWHALSKERALDELRTTPQGLDDREAAERLARIGRNVITAPPGTPWWRILAAQATSVVVLLLFVALVISLVLGAAADAIAIAAVLVLNIALGFMIELKGRRAMESLRALDVPEATVVRGGNVFAVDARDLVPGDIIQLDAGAAVPADARIVWNAEVQVQEASLTGESVPVAKDGGVVLPAPTPLADRSNMVYKATTVTNGSARAAIVATGKHTEIGRIGTLVASIRDEPTPLERRLAVLGKRLAVASVAIGALVAGLEFLRHSSLASVLQTGIAVAVAAVPEALPAVVTIAMAIGIRRMAARNALIRRPTAVESLGSATVVCTDKTGTLTAGEQTVTTVWIPDEEIGVSGAGYEPSGTFSRSGAAVTPDAIPGLQQALEVGVLCNHARLSRADGQWRAHGDPTEAALLVAAAKAQIDEAALRDEWPQVGELPFSSARMLMATVHRARTGGVVAMVKGAPARVLDRCARVGGVAPRPMDAETRAAIDRHNRQLAERGLRVIAVARGEVDGTGDDALRNLTFVGLIGMTDPPAAGVADTIRRLREAGIRTLMLTGDQRGTALAVARELGLAQDGATILEGGEVDALSDADLAGAMGEAVAFSRVSPEAKLRIVSALRGRGEIVAMLGDGVNDAAALKKADIGVAMGRRGTDVAKDASGVILTDDRFDTVAAAVEEGRVVFDNVRKFVFYLFSCNLAEIAVLVVAGLASLPAPLTALQILWLNLVTDTFPALALALEPPEDDVMRRPPRDPRSSLLSREMLREAAFFAALIAAASLGAFIWVLRRSPGDAAHAPTVAFMTLALAQLLHLGNARSVRHVTSFRRATSNLWAVGALVLGAGMQLAIPLSRTLSGVLGVSPLTAGDWALIVAFATVPAVVGQGLRMARRRVADDEHRT